MPAIRDIFGSRGHLSARVEGLSLGDPARLLLGAALLSLAACGGEEPVFTKLFTTEHFVYYAEEGVTPPCDGTDQWLERYYNANAKFLGAALPPGERIEYYNHRSPESLPLFGCPPTSGCAAGTTIRSTLAVHLHEIVHANASLLGDPPLLFQEGLAEIMGCQEVGDLNGPAEMPEPIETLVESVAFKDWVAANGYRVYGVSASFVRYLIDTFGASSFLSFYERAQRGDSREEIEAIFQAAMGSSLDDAFSDWRTKPLPYGSEFCLRPMDCDPSIPSLVDAEVAMGCGPLGVYGNTLFRFEVPTERTLRIATEPVATEPQALSFVSFYHCADGNAIGKPERAGGFLVDADLNVHLDPAQPARAFALDVPPGEYAAWFSTPDEARIHVDVEERGSPMRNATCQVAEEPLVLDDKHQTILTSRWNERSCNGPWCPGQSWDVSIGMTGGALEAQAVVVNNEANTSPGELYICSEPCPLDTSKCEIMTLDTVKGSRVRSKQTFEPGTVLHLGAPAAPFAEYFNVRLRVAPE